MKSIKFFFLIFPFFLFSQELLKCNDSINYIVKNLNSKNIAIKIEGKIRQLENPQIFLLNDDTIIQLLTNETKDYLENGKEEIPIIATYVLKEAEYFSELFKEKINLAMLPEDLLETKKALFWHFNLPQNTKSKESNELKALKSVFISLVENDEIITIGTTQFENQKLENIEKILIDLAKNVKVNNNKNFCE